MSAHFPAWLAFFFLIRFVVYWWGLLVQQISSCDLSKSLSAADVAGEPKFSRLEEVGRVQSELR